MKKNRWMTVLLAGALLLCGCGQTDAAAKENVRAEKGQAERTKPRELTKESVDAARKRPVTSGKLPKELAWIPQNYFTEGEHPGKLVELTYDTYESMTYGQKSKVLKKRAIVYLPYGYSEDEKYNVFYLMHGG